MRASVTDFIDSLKDNTSDETLKNSFKCEQDIPFYDGNVLRSMESEKLNIVKKEWADCWIRGAGVLIISDFYSNTQVVDDMSLVMYKILENEQRAKKQRGTYSAKESATKKIWNVLEKSATEDPGAFINYYSNPLLGHVCEAWLGPGYTMTAQFNLMPPNSNVAQAPHVDYHLGFQTNDEVAKFPLHAQTMSAMLSLQGAIAHDDMPIESGPIRFLPYSQQYNMGYQLYHEEEFKNYFEENAVQLPLNIGDAVFFSPALMHSAGVNNSDEIQRLTNLLQISSPFGKPIEMIDHDRIQLACYEALKSSLLVDDSLDTLLTVMSESNPFSNNLKHNITQKSLIPVSNKELLLSAIEREVDKPQYEDMIRGYRWRQSPF